MPRPKRGGRKGLQKSTGVRGTKLEQELRVLRKAGKLVEGMSLNARRWLRSQLG